MKRTPIARKTQLRAKRAGGPRPGRLDGQDMMALRDQVIKRDGCRCTNCGVMTNPWLPPIAATSAHLAHIRNKRMFGDSPKNTRLKCGTCHREYHQYGPSREKAVPAKEVR